MSTATILIPGVKGTTLVNSNTLSFDMIWSGIQSKYESIFDLQLNLDPRFDLIPGALIERSDVEDLAYAQIVRELRRKLGCHVYIFAYDWRRSCRDVANVLEKYVDHLKGKLGVDNFNFVTHSMGGVVFSCYLKKLNGKYDLINKAVLTVCPFKGAVGAMIALIKGEGGIPFPLFNSDDSFRKIARTFPSVYELCPTYQGAIVSEADGQDIDILEYQNWQSNVVEKKDDPAVTDLMKNRIDGLKKFYDINDPAMIPLDRLPPDVQKKILVVAGDGEKTRQSIEVKAVGPDGKTTNFFDFDKKNITKKGDGTVPLKSATCFSKSILTLAVKSVWYDGATHGFFLNDGRVQTAICRFLKDDTAHPNWWSDIAKTVSRM